MNNVYLKIYFLIVSVVFFSLDVVSQELVDDSTGAVATSSNPREEVKLREELSVVKANIERELRLEPALKGIVVNVLATENGFLLRGDVPNSSSKKIIIEIAGRNSGGIEIIDQLKLLEVNSELPKIQKQSAASDKPIVDRGESQKTEEHPEKKSEADQRQPTTLELKKRDDIADKIMRKKQKEDRIERKTDQS